MILKENFKLLNKDRTLMPFFAMIFMAIPLTLSLLWLKSGLHVSGVFSVFCPANSVMHSEKADSFFCTPEIVMPDKSWIFWMVSGLFIGAFFSALWRNRGLRLNIERISSLKRRFRLALATVGGLLGGFGAALAGGCTSSIGLTGAALLSVGAFSFLILFFLGGFVSSTFFGRFWND